MNWAAGEDKRMAQARDEYQRPRGKHRAQAPKPAQAGPSLPPQGPPDMAAALATVKAACQDLDDFNEVSDGPTMRAYRVVAQALADREEAVRQLQDALSVREHQLAARMRAPHTTTVTQSPTTGTYWWTCTCGDEGGPFDHYTPALDATVAHEREPQDEGGAMNLTPKQEIIVTLEAAWRLLDGAEPPAVRLAQLRGLIDHSRALAQRVGEMAKARKEPGTHER